MWMENARRVTEKRKSDDIEMPPKHDNGEWREVNKKRLKAEITTREFAEMCGLKPSRWCDIREGRAKPTDEEAESIRAAARQVAVGAEVTRK